ncbi:MAG: hypothetical protein AAGC53_02555 [Actinomycetota bacterium]
MRHRRAEMRFERVRRLRRDERGVSLPEVLIAMSLTLVSFTAIAALIGTGSSVVNELADDDPLTAVAVDWLARDLREATDLDVISTASASDVSQIDITTPDGVVRWGTSAGVIGRRAPGATQDQPLASGVRATDALLLTFTNADGVVVDPTVADSVDDCVWYVQIRLLDPDDTVLHDRTVSVRYHGWAEPTC